MRERTNVCASLPPLYKGGYRGVTASMTKPRGLKSVAHFQPVGGRASADSVKRPRRAWRHCYMPLRKVMVQLAVNRIPEAKPEIDIGHPLKKSEVCSSILLPLTRHKEIAGDC